MDNAEEPGLWCARFRLWAACRTAFLVGVSVCMMAVTLLTALAEDVSLLWLTAPLSGLAYGGHWSLVCPSTDFAPLQCS